MLTTFVVSPLAALYLKFLNIVYLTGLTLSWLHQIVSSGLRRHAIYTARSVITNYVLGGSIVNVGALYISKPFDKVDHLGFCVKLMNRRVPNVLLDTLKNWFSKCYICVRWCSVWSSFLTARRYASAGLCDSDVSVRMSVRQDVRLSQAGIVPSRTKAGS